MLQAIAMTLVLFQLVPPTLEGEWVVEVIDGITVLPESRVTISFRGTVVSGHASCNSYTGRYRHSGSGIKMESILTTLKACYDARMSEERDYLTLLRSVTRYEIRTTGVLLLTSDTGKTIAARRK